VQEIITNTYKEEVIPEHKTKRRKLIKKLKIDHTRLEEIANKIQEMNQSGSLATIPKLLNWLKEEKGLKLKEDQLRYYVKKMGFEWGKIKKKGYLFESKRVQGLRKEYLRRKIGHLLKNQEQGEVVKPFIFTDETFIHQNHTSNQSWYASSSCNLIYCNY
jgi:transposase